MTDYEKAMLAFNDQWPALKTTTKASLQREVRNARHHFKDNKNLLSSLEEFSDELRVMMSEFDSENHGGISAVSIYGLSIAVAVLALRIAEEGDAKHTYARQLIDGPLFRVQNNTDQVMHIDPASIPKDE